MFELETTESHNSVSRDRSEAQQAISSSLWQEQGSQRTEIDRNAFSRKSFEEKETQQIEFDDVWSQVAKPQFESRQLQEVKAEKADDVAPEFSRKTRSREIEVGDDDVSATEELINTEIKRNEDGSESFKSKDGFEYKKEKDGSVSVKDPSGVEYKVSPENELTVTQKDGQSKTYKPSRVLRFRDGGSESISYPPDAQFAIHRGIRGNIRVTAGEGTAYQHGLETAPLSQGNRSTYSIVTPKKK